MHRLTGYMGGSTKTILADKCSKYKVTVVDKNKEKTAHAIVEASNSSKVIVEKSELPVRTAEALEKILNSNEKESILMWFHIQSFWLKEQL